MSAALIGSFYDLLADQLAPADWETNRAVRAGEALDGLQLYGQESVDYSSHRITEDLSTESIAAAWLVAQTCADAELANRLINMQPKTPEVWQGLRLGMRLTSPYPWLASLNQFLSSDEPLAAIVAWDVLSFHRLRAQPNIERLMTDNAPEIRSLAIGCLGRTGDRQSHAFLMQTLNDTDPVIRLLSLRAAARAGLPNLQHHCRAMSVSHMPCLNSIRFLGVIAADSDCRLLRQLATHERTAAAAVEAMGCCGASELIPDILNALSQPLTADAAANALERISGRGVPRADPPPPPEHLTEEELDFWSPPGEPIPAAAEQWWRQNHYYFEKGKRYQAGQCVSDDPLGPVWEVLPDIMQRDVYLRMRALYPHDTPDWELETWPGFRQQPAWASQANEQRT